jgi:hypothetical protein
MTFHWLLSPSPCVGPIEVIAFSIKRIMSSIVVIAPFQNVIRTIGPSCENQGNWGPIEVLTFIKCKKQKHINFK